MGWTSATPYTPEITVRSDATSGSSQFVVPLQAGSLGGTAPALDYPPRPFVPSR